MKVEIVTRAIAVYVDMASFIINELKQIGIDATLKQIETAQWHAMATRGEYQIGANLTGMGIDDPDANFYENFACGSPRNYTFYCNEQIGAMFDKQSAEIDPKKRLALVLEIQRKLEDEAAPTHADVARRQLHALAAGEEPGPAQQLLQLRPDARSLARQVDRATGGVKTYIAQRLGIAVLTLFGMSVVIFVLLRLAPGDIVDVLFSAAGYVNPSEKKAILQELGIDKPFWRQYVEWISQIFVGDLGKSYRYDLPAWQIIKPLIPVTVELAILSTIISVVLGVPTGVISAVRQDSTLDYALRVFSLAGLSMPSFWLGMVIILSLVTWLAWIPPLTYVSPRENLWLHAVQFMLPSLAVGYRSSALIMRITRSAMLEVLREDYVRTAWAKGQNERVVVWRHALKNAVLPVVTVIGIEFAFLIGGLVVTETVFNLPGVARFLVEAILWRDYPVVQNLVMFIAIVVILSNLVVDLLYGVLDPRVRYAK